MYVFYERFYYVNSTSKMLTKTFIVNRVICHENVDEGQCRKLVFKYGDKAVSYCKRTKKAYLRSRARRATVVYWKDNETRELQFVRSWSNNEILKLIIEKGEDIEEVHL